MTISAKQFNRIKKQLLNEARNERYYRGRGRRGVVDVCCAAAFERAGIDPSPLFGADTANNAADLFGHGGGNIGDIAKYIIDIEGAPDPANTRDRIEAAFSTASGTDFFNGTFEVALQSQFTAGADTSQGWTIEREVDTFKTQRRPRIEQGEQLKVLPRGETAEHLELNLTSAETYNVARFARQFVVDSQDIADDDTDALIAPAALLGRAALALKLDLIYSVLLENAALADSIALFHASHSNLQTGAGLAQATLDTAISDVATQTEGGRPLNLNARYLLVPPALKGAAKRLVRDMATDDDDVAVRSESRLSLGVTDPRDGQTSYAGSATTWFMAAEDAPTIEFGFIDSARPVVSTFALERGQWGIGGQVKWDIGAKALDYRGLHRNDA